MRSCGRSIALVAMTCVLAWSCSKPVAPRPPVDGGSELPWTGPGVPDPQTALVRLRFVGPTVTIDANGRPRIEEDAVFLIDGDPYELEIPRDTVPAGAMLEAVRWRLPDEDSLDFLVDPDPIFRLDGPDWGTEFVARPGPKILFLARPSRVGGDPLILWYQQNFSPDWWWAGPDPSRFPPSTDGDGRAVDVLDWSRFQTSPVWPPDGRGFFGPDSFATLFSQRPPVEGDVDRRTFYEIWGDRIYARSENDTVHEGAWLVFSLGGYDRDSPYVPRVDPAAPTLPPGFASQADRYPLLVNRGLAGSPTGFRIRVPVRDSNGGITQPSETVTFPNFDINDIRYHPNVLGYTKAIHPGKAYAEIVAEDGHAQVGRILENMVELADRVDAGGGSDRDRQLRRYVLTFFVRPEGPVNTARGSVTRSARGAQASR